MRCVRNPRIPVLRNADDEICNLSLNRTADTLKTAFADLDLSTVPDRVYLYATAFVLVCASFEKLLVPERLIAPSKYSYHLLQGDRHHVTTLIVAAAPRPVFTAQFYR